MIFYFLFFAFAENFGLQNMLNSIVQVNKPADDKGAAVYIVPSSK